jgi:hypothetical protein
MPMPRRAFLLSGLAVLAAPRLLRAQEAPPPILFVHGNGDHAALWMTTLWRFESNGWPRERLMAVNMPDPLARDDDAVPQPGRSGSAEQTERLAAFAAELRRRTGAARIAMVANSRGGYPIRDLVVHRGGSEYTSHAVLCGTPNRGVYDWPENRNGEFNSNSDFLRRLNGGATDVAPGTAFLTLRSDANDLFAQPRAVWSRTPERATGTDVDGPELRGATNLVLPGLDHREVAYHWRAFREMFRFIAGREPERLTVLPEERPVARRARHLDHGGAATNRPVPGALVEVWRVHHATAERVGDEPVHRETTGAEGRWGPMSVAPELGAGIRRDGAGAYGDAQLPRGLSRAPPTSVHLRPARPLTPAERQSGGGVVLFTRPRGYFGIPRDVVLLDGRQPPELRPGVAVSATATARLPAAELGRPVPAVFNEERIVARAWSAAENRISVAELIW